MFSKLSIISLASAALTAATPLAARHEVTERTVYSGEATYYYQDGAAGSCGTYNSDSAYIGALSTYWMDNGKDYCNGEIIVTATSGPASGKSITILIADTCESCDETHIGKFK